jgi:tetratricopeptide (TPR) repeat protein
MFMPIVRDLVKSILGNIVAICFVLICVFFFILPIAAQPIGTPDPQEVKRRIKQKLESDLYINWNYYVSGKQRPSAYNGRQEGGPPDPKMVEKVAKESLPIANKNIRQDPSNAVLYEARGAIYAGLYDITEDLNEQATYAERALADFNKAIELEPGRWSAFEQRAGLLKSVDFFAYFDVIVSDYLEEIRLIKSFCTKHPDLAKSYKSIIPKLFLTISRNYWNRAKALSNEPELLAEVRRLNKQYSTYSYWKDFDTAIDYAQKNITEPNEVGIIINYLVDKGDAAYRLGKYKISLNAYNAGIEYWDKTAEFYCVHYPNLCDSHKKQSKEYTFTIRLIKVYVKLEKWETVIGYLNNYLSNSFNTYCPEPYLVRARIYRHLGKTNLAIADEQTASKLPLSQVSCYESSERWK